MSTRRAVLNLGHTSSEKVEDPKFMTQARGMKSESLRAGGVFKDFPGHSRDH